ncbi:hypothetical protein MKZ26_20145 [Sporosarcina sp. FSL K6-6792]|uniref:hypothetical protein n=1 Tax=Sporosarcina sp. FSL K6-6792 TaxID=2921559 RepID=UPI0030FB903C
MLKKEDIQLWDSTDEVIRRMNVALYGFDISKLSVKEQKFVEESAVKRWELEEEAARRDQKPSPVLSDAKRLEKRRVEVLEAKIEKIAGGKPLKQLSNEQLEKQLKIMRRIYEWKGGL